MINIISMQIKEQHCPQPKEGELRKLIKSLSKISDIQTREIRKNIEKESQLKNKNRLKYQVENDQLLNEKQVLFLPNLLVTYKLFENKDKKVENIKERYIQSQAFLKRANFQSKKIEQKRRDIARKHYHSEFKYKSAPLIEKEKMMIISQPKLQIANAFSNANQEVIEEVDFAVLDRIKSTVHSSRKEMKNLYQSHIKQLKSSPLKKIHHFTQETPLQSQVSSILSFSSRKAEQLHIKPTSSMIIGKPKKTKKSPLIDLMKISMMRSKNIQENDTSLTKKEKAEHIHTQHLIEEMKSNIEHRNRLKESIVLGQLKKLLYGDRKGRFIQDTTLKTRLKGQYSEEYMKVVSEQEQILNNFNGSFVNRRNLVQKFSNILGTLRQQGKSHIQAQVHQFTLQ